MADRNIVEVIDRIKKELPSDLAGVHVELLRIKAYSFYKAPEQMWQAWNELCRVLSMCLPDPLLPDTPEWAKKIGRIVRAEE